MGLSILSIVTALITPQLYEFLKAKFTRDVRIHPIVAAATTTIQPNEFQLAVIRK